MHHHSIYRKSQAGFSLVELLVSLGILALIGLAIVAFQINVLKFTRTIVSQLMAQQDARRAVAQMVSELRTATLSDSGAYPIESAGTSSIVFYANTDSDIGHERVRYFLQGSNLKRGIIKSTGNPPTYPSASETFSDFSKAVVNGTSSIFTYYDTNYTGTSSPLSSPINIPSVRHVKISLSVDETTRQPIPIVVTSSVTIRNLKDNY